MTKTLNTEILREQVLNNIESKKYEYIGVSHQIHENPEIGNQEYFASRLLTSVLEDAGFKVETAVAGHETSFSARFSSNRPGPTIGFLAEYDALPGIGHACGHNIIGTTSVAASISLSQILGDIGGEVVVLGTPAEEGGPNGSAKGSFVKHGLLEGIDACMMIHPYNRTTRTGPTLAVDPLDFEYIGKPAHAASSPEDGVNALDSVIQLFNGINAYRQHVTSDVRIHGIITDGGEAPNIVPEYAKARFFIRAATRNHLNHVTNRVKEIAEAAAKTTGAKLNVIKIQNEVDDFLLNDTFDSLFGKQIESLGVEYDPENSKGLGSSDAGNVSQVVPTIHPYIKIGPEDLVLHTKNFKDAARSPEGDSGLIIGAKSLALTGLELLTNQQALLEIRREFEIKKSKQ